MPLAIFACASHYEAKAPLESLRRDRTTFSAFMQATAGQAPGLPSPAGIANRIGRLSAARRQACRALFRPNRGFEVRVQEVLGVGQHGPPSETTKRRARVVRDMKSTVFRGGVQRPHMHVDQQRRGIERERRVRVVAEGACVRSGEHLGADMTPSGIPGPVRFEWDTELRGELCLRKA